MIKYLYIFFIAIFIIFLQQSILSASDLFGNLNALLILLVFMTIVFGFNYGFIWSVLVGLLLSFYSILPFGLFILVYLLVLLVVNILYRQIFTNLSFYTSLILMVIATIIYNLILLISTYLFYQLNVMSVFLIIDYDFLNKFVSQIILNLLAMALIFTIAKFTYKKLNLAFIAKHE
jgi:cell shape-determining protein MreD